MNPTPQSNIFQQAALGAQIRRANLFERNADIVAQLEVVVPPLQGMAVEFIGLDTRTAPNRHIPFFLKISPITGTPRLLLAANCYQHNATNERRCSRYRSQWGAAAISRNALAISRSDVARNSQCSIVPTATGSLRPWGYDSSGRLRSFSLWSLASASNWSASSL